MTQNMLGKTIVITGASSGIGAAAARELSLYESQLYGWRKKQQQQLTSSARESELDAENARLKRQLAEQAEELAILQKAATYFAKLLK